MIVKDVWRVCGHLDEDQGKRTRGGLKVVLGKVWRQEEVPRSTEEAGLCGSVVRSDTTGPL